MVPRIHIPECELAQAMVHSSRTHCSLCKIVFIHFPRPSEHERAQLTRYVEGTEEISLSRKVRKATNEVMLEERTSSTGDVQETSKCCSFRQVVKSRLKKVNSPSPLSTKLTQMERQVIEARIGISLKLTLGLSQSLLWRMIKSP